MDDVFKALADASRRSLLDRLHARNGQTLNDLCDGLAMTRQAVTKHLAILEAANLVTTFRHGREKLHYLNPVPIHQIGERWIKKFERGKLTALPGFEVIARGLRSVRRMRAAIQTQRTGPLRCGKRDDAPGARRDDCASFLLRAN